MTDSSRSIASASAWMALGTIVSRLTGFVRAWLIILVLGRALNADLFTGANTIPNALYILVAGGVFNVVLVPQLIRTMKRDADGGEAYAHRVVTLGLLVLALATAVLVLLTPVLMHAAFNNGLFDSALDEQRRDAELLMRLCLPQVFFYGAFVLFGQILNAHSRFGPMMWAPIANNVISCAVLGLYVVMFGATDGAGGFTTDEILVLGLGSTAGIVVQALLLVPYLRAAGFHFRPRFDFRGVGLGHTLKLGLWTLLFIIVNQVAFFLVQKIATGSTTDAAVDGGDTAGSTVYQFAFLITQVPHGVITVSVVTAAIPLFSRLAADHAWPQMRAEVSASLRLVMVAIAPVAVTIACLGEPLGRLVGGGDSDAIGHTIVAFAPAMVFFTVHYLMLRGFYACEDTRTPFLVQVVLSGVNITLAFVLTSFVDTGLVAAMLALAYGAAYLVGSAISAGILSRRIGAVFDRRTVMFLVRLAVACAAAAAVMLAVRALHELVSDGTGAAQALLVIVVATPLGALAFLLVARMLRVREISLVVSALTRRR